MRGLTLLAAVMHNQPSSGRTSETEHHPPALADRIQDAHTRRRELGCVAFVSGLADLVQQRQGQRRHRTAAFDTSLAWTLETHT